ncbi:MAG TPA: mechanosensitive ion channel [Oleiagrimonas sp.]|nr:mechanosensitive ion channel [Oleiagrimonas sp.]
MDYSGFTTWAGNVGGYLPQIVGAIVIFIVGWVVALICRALVRKGLGALRVNERLAGETKSSINVEKVIASVVFWVIMLFALIGLFNVLDLDNVSGPLSLLAAAVMLYLPRILLAAALVVIAWLVGTVLRKGARIGLASTGLDKKLAADDPKVPPMSRTLGDVVFWVVILLFLPAIIGALQMQGLLAPLTNMVQELLGFVPNIIAALFIGGIGYLIAKVLRNLVTSLLTATRVDHLTRGKDGTGGVKISELCGTLTFIFVLVPTLIAALQALEIAVVAQPAEHMLKLFMTAIPNIVAAALIVFVAWFIGRFVAQMLSQLLSQIGFDRLPARVGFKSSASTEVTTDAEGGKHATPSDWAGRVALWFVMAFAVMEAAHRLGFTGIDALFEQLIAFASQVAFGLIILAVGQWLASVAAKAIRNTSGKNSAAMARIAYIGIFGLVAAMGLHAMGFGEAIVDLAFGLALGAVAVAVALSFGLGGRDAAGRITRHWVDGYLDNKNDHPRND